MCAFTKCQMLLTVVLDRVRDRGFGTGTWTECLGRDSPVGVACSVRDIL